MPAISLKVKSNVKLVVANLERLRLKIPEISRKRLYDAAAEIRSVMKEPGEEVVYPVQWDSEKQRKAFFASDGFGAGIPYKRKGIYEKNWQIKPINASKGHPTAIGYDVFNPLKHSIYIGGTSRGARQSKIHKGRWNVFRDVVDKVVADLPKTVIRSIQVVARQLGFKVK